MEKGPAGVAQMYSFSAGPFIVGPRSRDMIQALGPEFHRPVSGSSASPKFMPRSTNPRLPAVLSGTIFAAILCLSAQAQVASPLDVNGAVLWLDGDDLNGDGIKDTGVNGTAITTWADKAVIGGAQSVTVTAGAPTIDFNVVGTHNAVRFVGGTQDKLDNLGFNLAGDYTVFTVVQSDGFGAGSHVLSGINNNGTDAVLYRGGDGAFRFYSGQTTGSVDRTFGQRPTS